MILITSCRSPERALVCSEIKKQEIPPYEKCAIDFKNQWCRCFMFDANRWKQVSEPKNYELTYCDGIQGGRISTEAEVVRPKVKALWRLKANLCDNQEEKSPLSKTSNSLTTTQPIQREKEFFSR